MSIIYWNRLKKNENNSINEETDTEVADTEEIETEEVKTQQPQPIMVNNIICYYSLYPDCLLKNQKIKKQGDSYTITVLGRKPTESPIWKRLKYVMKIDFDDQDKSFSGTYSFQEFKNKPMHLLISAATKNPDQPQNGIIFLEPQKDSEAFSHQFKANSFLFIDTDLPNCTSAAAALFYIYSHKIGKPTATHSFEMFLRRC